MRTFIRGSDEGNVMLTALALIIMLSTLFISFALRITATNNYSREYKTRVLHAIMRENMEVIERYDLH